MSFPIQHAGSWRFLPDNLDQKIRAPNTCPAPFRQPPRRCPRTRLGRSYQKVSPGRSRSFRGKPQMPLRCHSSWDLLSRKNRYCARPIEFLETAGYFAAGRGRGPGHSFNSLPACGVGSPKDRKKKKREGSANVNQTRESSSSPPFSTQAFQNSGSSRGTAPPPELYSFRSIPGDSLKIFFSTLAPRFLSLLPSRTAHEFVSRSRCV